MHSSIKYIFLISAFLLSACQANVTSSTKITSYKPTSSAEENARWNQMTGTWYGSQPTQDGGKKEAISRRSVDGTYEVTFRVTAYDGHVEEFTEVGEWGISGPVYFTIFRGRVKHKEIFPADPSDPYHYDAYKILSLDNHAFSYEHFSTGNTYHQRKVAHDFHFNDAK